MKAGKRTPARLFEDLHWNHKGVIQDEEKALQGIDLTASFTAVLVGPRSCGTYHLEISHLDRMCNRK